MRLISLFAILTLLITACKKDEPVCPPAANVQLKSGILVLCEGLFQQNNSTISWVDLSSGAIENAFFTAKTNRQLGDTGNDLKRYGGKVYVVVDVSSSIEVLSAKDFTPVKRIEMINGTTAKHPRSITFHNGKAYVSCFDGHVDVIDTTTLAVTQRIQVGSNPEGLAVSGSHLYVANSGGLNFPNPDSTVSVIDLNTHSEVTKITVGINPGAVVTDNSGEVYVISRGDYSSVPSRLKRIDPTSNTVIESFSFDISGIAQINDKFLVHDGASVSLFNPATEAMEAPNYLNISNVTTLYGLSYSSVTDKIYITDAMNYTNTGYVRVFSSSTGLEETSYHVGLNPSKVLIFE